MDKLKLETKDLTEENIKKIGELFPQVITEGRVNFTMLRDILGDIVERDEAYEFSWVGKQNAIIETGKPINKTLRPCKAESKDWDTTENLYIEGDNLDVLKVMQESYLGKVKMIYIDPPYNTGTAMIYSNDYSVDELEYFEQSGEVQDGYKMINNPKTSARFHSRWLSMMYSRLIITRNLLTDDGFAVLAMDDSEIENLVKLCDEVFGEENRLGIVSVVHKPEGRNQEKFFGTSNEFCLFYARNKEKAMFNSIAIDDEVRATFNLKDEKGYYRANAYINKNHGNGGHDTSSRENRPHFWYPIYVSQDLTDITLTEKENYVKVFPINTTGQERTWRTLPQEFTDRLNKGLIFAKKENNRISIFEKYYENQVIKTHWINKKYHATHCGTRLLDSLMEVKTFDFPKSLYLLIDILKLTTNTNDLILDFFSGSATTAHAVMQLNAEDGGNRKFIMVQLPEECDAKSVAYKAGYKNICEIGKERIRRAGEKIKQENPDKKLDTGFRVLKLDESNYNDVYLTPSETKQEELNMLADNIRAGRTDEDLLYGCLLAWGVPLDMTHEIETIDNCDIHIYGDNALVACFSENIPESVIKYIAKRKPLRTVFRDSGFKRSDEKINALEIFKSEGLDEKAVKVI